MRLFDTQLVRRLAIAAVLAAAASAAACGDDNNGPFEPDLGIDTSGTLTGEIRTAGREDTVGFIAARNGIYNVGVCGPEGVDFDIVINDDTTSSPSNCERDTVVVSQARATRIVVISRTGTGPISACFGYGTAQCDVPVPIVAACTPRPFSTDTTTPANYYATAAGKTGKALFDALYAIVCTQRSNTYDRARDSLYAYVDDPDNNDIITDIYVGRSATINSRATATAAGFQTEHSWPQSKGADDPPPESDLHHLFPSDGTANNQRSNFPFGNVTGAVIWESPAVAGQTERSRLGRDAQGRTVFEPRNSSKGDIARALLYFYTRYSPAPPPGFSLSNFAIEEQTLIQWHQQDPPDTYEKQRNALIFRAQGNRNPFVDHPEYVQAIGDF